MIGGPRRDACQRPIEWLRPVIYSLAALIASLENTKGLHLLDDVIDTRPASKPGSAHKYDGNHNYVDA